MPDEVIEEHAAGCREAALAGWQVLTAAGSALDAVEAAVRSMEDNPTYDAGVGSHLTADRRVELDAAVMDGSDLSCGAVASVRCIRNPVSLARLVMASPQVLIVGEGAMRFADEHGVRQIPEADLMVRREVEFWERLRAERGLFVPTEEKDAPADTVGAVAIDARGNIAVATSTGGTPYKYPGRVGDCPLIGAGSYADNAAGGAATTGRGEDVVRTVMGKRCVDLMGAGRSAQEAASVVVQECVQRVQGRVGIIAVDRRGTTGRANSTTRMSTSQMSPELREPITRVA
jgi:beta-aspartyl-peptidase (threonine type)